MARSVFFGFLSGLLLDVIIWFTGPLQSEDWWTKIIIAVSTPVAHVISWITGWKFMQEEAIMIYVFAIPITFPLIGILPGLCWYGVKGLRNR